MDHVLNWGGPGKEKAVMVLVIILEHLFQVMVAFHKILPLPVFLSLSKVLFFLLEMGNALETF